MNSGSDYYRGARLIDRYSLLQLLAAGVEMDAHRFARQAALGWLAVFPGDLEVSYYLARVFQAEGKLLQARAILEKVVLLDPENTAAHQALVRCFADGDAQSEKPVGCAYALGDRPVGAPAGEWVQLLRQARLAVKTGEFEKAEPLAMAALASGPDVPLAGVIHLRAIRKRNDKLAEMKFADTYHQRWPDTLPFVLSLGALQLESGEEAKAVNLLHQCVANDAAGQVAERWWGKNHPYQPLWPETLETPMDLPIPVEVSQRLGWNRLPSQSGKPEATTSQSESAVITTVERPVPAEIALQAMAAPTAAVEEDSGERENGKLLRRARVKSDLARDVEKEFERLAKRMKRPVFAKADGRFPMYVVCSSRAGLVRQYGEATADVVYEEMNRLVEAVGRRTGWGALLFCPDDTTLTAKYGLKPVPATDPWKIKLALVDLDHALEKKGGRIGALLLVGGAEVVPFHRLPNPTDDSDEDVLSDNPYGTLDSNYFVPEWSVGRFPGEAGKDAGLLLQQLRQAVKYHQGYRRPIGQWTPTAGLLSVWGSLFGLLRSAGSPKSFGYTAAVWKNASQETFRPIGESRSVMVSPPEFSGSFDHARLTSSALGFYNLHGLPDTNEWYGQREATDPVDGPDYPVALKATEIHKNGKTPQVIFTEACYGGFVKGKTESESIAMRFLSLGTPTVVGSSCTAYGSVGAPLIAADLLAFFFWKYLREGYNAGDSLLQAKIALVREMTRRQGYLDGEDQKTLISFMLFGDPLNQMPLFTVSAKRYVRQRSILKIKTVEDEWDDCAATDEMPADTLAQVKQALAPYLPGLERAEVLVQAQEMADIGEDPEKPQTKSRKVKARTRRTIVTFKKPMEVAQKTYFQFARVTLDGKGKMVKMVISR